MDQIATKYTNTLHCKTIKNLPKLGFLVWKYAIWQPWSQSYGSGIRNNHASVVAG
jgi:hypothetical protein